MTKTLVGANGQFCPSFPSSSQMSNFLWYTVLARNLTLTSTTAPFWMISLTVAAAETVRSWPLSYPHQRAMDLFPKQNRHDYLAGGLGTRSTWVILICCQLVRFTLRGPKSSLLGALKAGEVEDG